MANTDNTVSVLPSVFVGPCGCEACEKWADCDYCDGCTPVLDEIDWSQVAATDAEEELSFGEWLMAQQA